jgi:hypothetical protein
MRDLTSQGRAKDVLAASPARPIVVTSDGRPPKKKKKKKLATFEMVGAYESNGTSKSESKRWYFRLLLKVFGR